MRRRLSIMGGWKLINKGQLKEYIIIFCYREKMNKTKQIWKIDPYLQVEQSNISRLLCRPWIKKKEEEKKRISVVMTFWLKILELYMLNIICNYEWWTMLIRWEANRVAYTYASLGNAFSYSYGRTNKFMIWRKAIFILLIL